MVQASNKTESTLTKLKDKAPVKIVSPEEQKLLSGLKETPKQIPCSYLYDDKGSSLYNEITELEEYYPYRVELEMLHEYADDIIKQIPAGAVVVELGCGSASKTAILQRALLKRDGSEKSTFVGIDVSRDFLQQAKKNMLDACPGLKPENVNLIEASYLEGLQEARRLHPDAVLCVLWLGSSVGNLSPEESLQFFKQMIQIGGQNTQVLLCTDLWKDRDILHRAYCDGKGVTEAFIKNGMRNAISCASNKRFIIDDELWTYEVDVNAKLQQVEMYLTAGETVLLEGGSDIRQGEKILMEVSRKFTDARIRRLAHESGFFFQAQWKNKLYSIQMLCAPLLAFELCWRDTDKLFERIRDWSFVPISLRHPFCFYYGHVISFAKIKLFQDRKETEWDTMFSRGIDPDVSNPSVCHKHPAPPPQWPSQAKIIEYCQKGREMIRNGFQNDEIGLWLACLALEHERMHQETLCYMLAQQQKCEWEKEHLDVDGHLEIQNGSAFIEGMANWSKEAGIKSEFAGCNGGCQNKTLNSNIPKSVNSTRTCESNKQKLTNASEKVSNKESGANGRRFGLLEADSDSFSKITDIQWVKIPQSRVAIGIDLNPEQGFGWDNEGPPQESSPVSSFSVADRPVTIGEFRDFVLSQKGYNTREFWDAEGYDVVAAHQKCPATWTVTEDEDVWIHYPEGTWHWKIVQHRPVWCSLAEAQAYCKAKDCRVMTEPEYVATLQSCNGDHRVKQLNVDGWEHTSTVMEAFKGFEPMRGYPEYSADFLDGKHYISRGSSPYTHPSAARPSFRNFYQNVYTFEFAKFRCCV